MTVYVALLRGINVGGKNMIKMADLKQIFVSVECSYVQTYINSGNVVFESQETEPALLSRLERAIETELGLSIHVMVRTAAELRAALADSPYQDDVDPKGKNMSIGFLRESPSPQTVSRLHAQKGADEFLLIGRDLHLLFHSSVADSKLASLLNRVGEPVTVRNWNTVNKLATMADALEAGIGGQ